MVGPLVHKAQEGESVSFSIWLQIPQTQSKEEKKPENQWGRTTKHCGSARRVAKSQNTRRRRVKDKRNVWSTDD